MAMQMLGPKALGLLGKLTPKAVDSNVVISFKLTEAEITTVKGMSEKAFSGFAGESAGSEGDDAFPPGLDLGELEKELGDLGKPDAAEPAVPGDEAEAVDPDPGPGPSVTIIISGVTGAELRKKLSSAGEPGESVFSSSTTWSSQRRRRPTAVSMKSAALSMTM